MKERLQGLMGRLYNAYNEYQLTISIKKTVMGQGTSLSPEITLNTTLLETVNTITYLEYIVTLLMMKSINV